GMRACVRDEPASRLGEKAIGIAVEWAASRIRRELIGGDVGDRAPAAARRQVDEPAELITYPCECGPRLSLEAQPDRHIGAPSAKERDVVGSRSRGGAPVGRQAGSHALLLTSPEPAHGPRGPVAL